MGAYSSIDVLEQAKNVEEQLRSRHCQDEFVKNQLTDQSMGSIIIYFHHIGLNIKEAQ
jgi:hypothetical protein